MDISAWLVASFDDTVTRWRNQVVEIVPPDALLERFPNGNSILWATYHVARHADTALRVLGADRIDADALLAALPDDARVGGAGLQEVQQPWFDDVTVAAVEAYADAVFAASRAHLGGVENGAFGPVQDMHEELRDAGVDETDFAWLYGQWSAGGSALLTRWPLTSHITHHVGEMIATRNQLGLSPFR